MMSYENLPGAEDGLVGSTDDLDIDQVRAERYGDWQISLQPMSIILFDDDHYTQFYTGTWTGREAAEALRYLSEGEQIDRAITQSYGLHRDRDSIPFRRMSVFTDDDGRLPEDKQEVADELADDFFRNYLGILREEWREDLPEFMSQFEEEEKLRRQVKEQAYKEMAKSYPQSPSTIHQYL